MGDGAGLANQHFQLILESDLSSVQPRPTIPVLAVIPDRPDKKGGMWTVDCLKRGGMWTAGDNFAGQQELLRSLLNVENIQKLQ